MRLAPHGNMENRLVPLKTALRIQGDATRVSAAHADMSLLQGVGGVWLKKEEFWLALGALARLRILGLSVL